MKNKNVYYGAVFILLIVALIGYIRIDREKKKEHPHITELAVEPDLLVNTSDRYLNDHKRLTAIEFLEDAIEVMNLLKNDGDEVSIQAIEVAIQDLIVVKQHIKAKDIDEDFKYEAFADAMNSLAYASLRVSEKYIEEGKKEEATVTMKYAIEHLQSSIKYARGDQREEEIRIAKHLNELIEKHLESDLSQIDAIMAEIDSVIQAHIIK